MEHTRYDRDLQEAEMRKSMLKMLALAAREAGHQLYEHNPPSNWVLLSLVDESHIRRIECASEAQHWG